MPSVKPHEAVADQDDSHTTANNMMSIRVGFELKLFRTISQDGVYSVHELSKKTGAEEVLIRGLILLTGSNSCVWELPCTLHVC